MLISVTLPAMDRCLFIVIITQLFISEALSSYPYYFQQRPAHHQIPYPSYKQYYQPSYPNYYTHPKPKPSRPPKVPPPQIPQQIDLPSPPQAEKAPIKGSEKLDSVVLNNLAIALQLLIVSNLINNPPAESNFAPISEALVELVKKPLSLSQSSGSPGPCEVNYQMPNAKFLSSSNFGDDGMLKMAGGGNLGTMTKPGPRSGFGLMSPYDALANSNTENQKYRQSDFLNPYAAMSAAENYKDLFSIDF